jgi:hypothetical protein
MQWGKTRIEHSRKAVSAVGDLQSELRNLKSEKYGKGGYLLKQPRRSRLLSRHVV